MAWVKTIDEKDAQGLLRKEYDDALKRAGKIYNIVKISSLKPTIVRQSMAFYAALMHAPGRLSRARREMIAVVVSRANNCHY